MNLKISKIIRRVQVNSIQSVITLSFTAVTIISMLIISFSLFKMFSDNAEKRAAFSTQQIMDQVNINMEVYLKGMMEISDVIRGNINTIDDIENMKSLLDVTSKIRKDIVTSSIYTKNGELIISSLVGKYDSNFIATEQEWFKNAVNNPFSYIFQPPHVQRIFEGKHPWVVSLCRDSFFYDKTGKLQEWIVMVDMNFSVIEQLCKNVSLGKTGYIYVIDKNGRIIYHPQQQLIYTGLKSENINDALNRDVGSYFDIFEGKKRIMTVKNISYTEWKMVGISYVDELAENKRNLINSILVIVVFGLVFEIAASIFISQKVSLPIKRLEKQMKLVKNGDFNISVEVRGEDEVKKLSKSFNIMVVRIKQLMDEIIYEQEAKKKSELKALQSQINPHFLYNTLDSIIWMNENHKYEGVTTMANALAKFFRVSISKGHEIISIADEIEHARSYLTIQSVRYKDSFDFTIDVQPEVLEYKTLKILLQPLIENAIYHGVGQLQEKGEIKIKASIENNNILFSVSDNGYGIEPNVLKDILVSEPKKNGQTYGFGLKNVNERIKLYYGNEYGIEIDSELDVGTTVNIHIPIAASSSGG